MNAKILETFHSIQGEGKYIGVPQVFVRFFECNMHCVWCDTPHSIGAASRDKLNNASPRYKEKSLEELIVEIKALWTRGTHSVSITGGEPLMQTPFLKQLLPELKALDMLVYMETNGVFPDELNSLIDDVDIVAMDLKLPSSTQCDPYWDEHAEFLKVAQRKDVFIKTVITSDTSKEDVIRASQLVADADRDVLFILQPNFLDMKNCVVKRCVEFEQICAQYLSDVRVIPQTHKFLKVR